MPTDPRSSAPGMTDSMAQEAPTLHQQAGTPYLANGHQQLLEKLEHLARYSQYIQVVTGAPGSGKAALLGQFRQLLDSPDIQLCSLVASYESNISGLLDQLLEQLAVEQSEFTNDRQKLQAIQQQSAHLADLSRILLITIDHAECLDDNCLELLFNYLVTEEAENNTSPHLLLIGLPQLLERLQQHRRLQDALENRCHLATLPPLDLIETKEFLFDQFAEQAALLSERQIAKIHQLSLGLPGRIPTALTNVQQDKAKAKNPKSQTFGRQAIRLGATLVVVLLLGSAAITGWFLYNKPANQSEQVQLSLPIPESANSDSDSPNMIEDQVATENNNGENNLLDHFASSKDLPDYPTKTTADADTANPDNLAVAPMAEEDKPASSATSESQPPTLKTPAGNTLVLQLKPASQAAAATPPPAPPAPTVTSQPAQPVTEKQPGSNTQIAKAPAQTPAATAPSKPDYPYQREQELLSWERNGYTLQVLGARKVSSVVDFIHSRTDKNKFYSFSTIYKEKPWYVVVYGNYKNREEAVAAISSLPNDLRKQKPWARSIKGVQEDIRREQ